MKPANRAVRTLLGILALVVLAAAPVTGAGQNADPRRWLPLAKDDLHDPRNPALKTLQEPREALSPLAPDTAGNQVRWVEALARGQIDPRSRIQPSAQVRIRETEIYLNLRGGTPIVKFPHRSHTLWLDCSNCHDALFKQEVGATAIDMRRILQGEQCGLCHGAVAFPLTECNRCHNTPREGRVPDARNGPRAALVPPAAPPKAAK